MTPHDTSYLAAGGPYLCPLCLGRSRRALVQVIFASFRITPAAVDAMPDCHVCAGARTVRAGLVLVLAIEWMWAVVGCACVACKVVGPGPTDSSRAKVGDDEDVPRVLQP